MNYRHAFHAGNFADVFKHVLLMCLLKALQRKEKGCAYIETHAGAGRYDLRAIPARETNEYRGGVGRLWNAGSSTGVPAFDAYLSAVRVLNRGQALRIYPGSPRIARFLLRAQDRMRLAEQVPDECARLRAEFASDRQVAVHCGDGYGMLKAWLPPPERRGLVLIDPPYEQRDEWRRVIDALALTSRRWPQGTYAVWYPLKVGAPVERFKSEVVRTGLRKILLAELSVWSADTPFRLNGCGMLIVNPPWKLDADLGSLLPLLAERLRQGPEAAAGVEWLVPE